MPETLVAVTRVPLYRLPRLAELVVGFLRTFSLPPLVATLRVALEAR